MNNVAKIIDYQEEIQRTPEEAVEYLQEVLSKYDPERILILCWEDDKVEFIPAAKDRDFANKDIFWDVTGWLDLWRRESE